MRHIAYKTIAMFCSIICFGTAMVSCQDDEELNLLGYPENPISVNAEDGDNMNISATYDAQGKLVLSSSLNRTWRISLATPSPEDASIKIAPLLVNIPADKVTLDTDIINLPAGSLYQDVTLGVNEEDLAFMEDNLQAEVYELGVTVSDANGLKLNTDSSLGKLVVEKEKYLAKASVESERGSLISFEKAYWNNKIYGSPIFVSFKVVLDKPAKENVTIKLAIDGVPENFVNTSIFTPSTVIIETGEKESEDIIWTIADDFLKTTDEAETFNFKLKAEVSDTEYVEMNSEASNIAVEIVKSTSMLEMPSYQPSDWVSIDRYEWTVNWNDKNWIGKPKDILDNYLYSSIYVESDKEDFKEFTIDLIQKQTLVGIKACFGYNWTYDGFMIYSPSETEILVSKDNKEWTSLGLVKGESSRYHYIKFLASVEARYVKYRGKLDAQIGKLELTELYMFKTRE